MTHYAIIVAGGTGQRFGSQIPKQFLPLKGLPILMHTINTFHAFDGDMQIVITLPPDFFDLWKSLCDQYKFNIKHKIVQGGETRFHSVRNGLDAIGNEGLVGIHDAVRPLVSRDTLERCFAAAKINGNAIPVVPLIDSIRELRGDNSVQLNRDTYVLIQTPQVFEIGVIKQAFKQSYSPDFTDDATVLEKTGKRIILVEGNRENIKITNQSDMLVVEALLRR
jgi:2-C-methyl-D-erythritol 4-phosphate cytidylyltransferase